MQPSGELTASNKIVLNQLAFGDKVEGSTASLPVKLAAYEVKSFNLRDWIVQGNAPGRAMPGAARRTAAKALPAAKCHRSRRSN